jgi:hypothetical protein
MKLLANLTYLVLFTYGIYLGVKIANRCKPLVEWSDSSLKLIGATVALAAVVLIIFISDANTTRKKGDGF